MSPDKPTLNASGVAHGAKHDRPDLLKSAQCIQARPHSSGFKSFLNWFKKVEKLQRQRADAEEEDDSATDASSVSSDSSTATVASFAFLEPNVYRPYGDALQPEKYIASGPYTDTYNRLILERDRRRNLDKNVTLRKKYQLHSSGLTLNGTLKPDGAKSNFAADENDEIKVYETFSLPAMNKINATNVEFQNKEHRRAASETKFVRPLSYVHVKGKRRAPLPPGCTLVRTNRKKRAAPPPPFITEGKDHSTEVTAPATPTSVPNTPTIEPSAVKSAETIKPALYHSKSEEVTKTEMSELSPRPWYKRQFSDNKGKSKKAQSEDSKAKNKTELPEIGFFRYSKIFDTKKNFNSDFSGNEKRISGIHILPNISELDREASEIISMHKKIIREENNNESNPKIENLANPRSARELITKFNAMQKTNALPSQPNILLDSELIPSNKTPATRLCENEVQKSENKKNESKPVEVKVETSNWTCTKCKFQNKSFQHICSICYTRRTEPVAPTKVTDNLFKSFEAEVFDALSHLGNMSKEETKNSGNKASSSSENKVLSSDENKEASSSANKMASASANKIASASENKVASASEKKVASACERKVASADENKVSALSGNKMPSSSENKASLTNNNDKNLLKNKEEEKQKLRELLKEMKNSLPKRPKSAIVTSYPGNSPEKMLVQRPAQVNGPKIVDVNVSTKIEPINVKSESNIGINPLYKPKGEIVSSDIKTQHVEKLDKVIKKSSNKTDSSAQTNDCKESRSVNSTQPAITENLYANVGDKIVIATKKTNADGLVNQNITDLKDPKVLLRKLEMAISKGDDIAAATIARQLAILKINCTVLSSTVTESNTNNSANVEVYIEDQDSHHGPIQLSIGKEMNIAELKQSIAKELNIPINIQRWIIGKQLAVDETEPVKQYNKNDFSQPMFLYLVSPAKDDAKTVCTKQIDNPETIVEPRKVLTKQELKKESPIKDTSVPSSSKVTGNSSKDVVNNSQKILAKKGADHYLELLNLDSQDLIKNMVTFECAICFQDCKAGDGVVLRECLHSFCKECLANTIRYSEEVEIQCPFRDYSYTCESVMQEREIKALVPKDAFEQHLAKSVTVAENSMQKTFHCKSADCKGWCIYEDNVNYFRCPVCRKTNCLTCQAIHEGENCKQYQERIKQNSETDLETLDGQRTKQMLEEMVNKGDAMVCPSCQVVLMKKWGCDWLRCSMCKTEICWVTRGPRWGPAGKGDTTGGCQCGVNGVKCHPKCNYCH